MAATISRMTKAELKEMIETTVERKLLELLDDPDKGQTIRKSVRDRLVRQRKAVASGQRGGSFAEAAKRLGLD